MIRPSRTAQPAFAVGLERWGEATALVYADEALSYAELAHRADEFASSLCADVRLLAVEAQNCLEPVVAYLGALRAGLPVLLFSTGGSPDALRAVSPDAVYAFDAEAGAWALSQAAQPWEAPPHPDLALLLPTSG